MKNKTHVCVFNRQGKCTECIRERNEAKRATPPAGHGAPATHTPTPWTVMEGKTLLHIETANMNDGKPCGMPVCSIPKARSEDARHIVKCVNRDEVFGELLEAVESLSEELNTSRCRELIRRAEGVL